MTIAFDAISHSTVPNTNLTSGTALTWTHTVTSNTNGILLIGCSYESNGSTPVTAISYAGTSALSNKVYDAAPATFYQHALYYLLLPATGANTVSITFGVTYARITGWAMSLTGVDQTTPIQSSNTATGTTSPTAVVITSATGNWIADVLDMDDGGFNTITVGSNGTNRTQRMNLANGSSTGFVTGVSTCDGASSVSMNWTDSNGATRWAAGGVSLTAAATSSFPVGQICV